VTAGPLQLGGSPLLPTRRFADEWPAYCRERLQRLLAAYRARVTAVYQELAGERPDSFDLLEPTEILVVVTLVREWVFTRPAATDTITLVERWEDPHFATWDMVTRADHEQRARRLAAVPDDYELLDAPELSWQAMRPIPNANAANPEFAGRALADQHARHALAAPALEKWQAAMIGRSIDEAALTTLRAGWTRSSS
jgi:hypothetical protein